MSLPSGKGTLDTQFERLQLARDVIKQEYEALQRLHSRLPDDFDAVVQTILNCKMNVVVCGIGKAGWIGQKLSATLASTGTPSIFLHPSEAMHGDLGRVRSEDVILVLSNSGETDEILQLLPTFKRLKATVIAVTASRNNSLAKNSRYVFDYGSNGEACPHGLAPSTSTTLMLCLGDALALVVSQARQFGPMDFARFHPGGSLGKQLSIVNEVMRPLVDCRVAEESETVRHVYTRLQGKKRRSGAILVVDDSGFLTGLFTDSDLARLLEHSRDEFFDQPLSLVMTKNPITIESASRTSVAVETLACNNISELPVVSARNKPLGIIDITDVVGFVGG